MKMIKLLCGSLLMISLEVLGDIAPQRKSTAGYPEKIAPDNTKVNASDSVVDPTAENQGMNYPDMELTRRIRESVTKDDSLSTYAHNIKIITENGRVTLRGPVRSQGEKNKIEAKASQIAGEQSVINDLQLAIQP
jgi:hypothetical protein